MKPQNTCFYFCTVFQRNHHMLSSKYKAPKSLTQNKQQIPNQNCTQTHIRFNTMLGRERSLGPSPVLGEKNSAETHSENEQAPLKKTR